MESTTNPHPHVPWNKGKLVGQKTPFKAKEVWAIRARLQMENRSLELALFDLGIDSKLRACDLVKLRVRDVCHGDRVASRATVLQQKTQRPVQSRSRLQLGRHWRPGSGRPVLGPTRTCSRVGCIVRRNSVLVSTPACSTGGCLLSGWTPRTTGPTRCGAPRRQ